jgi:hypothetical protein
MQLIELYGINGRITQLDTAYRSINTSTPQKLATHTGAVFGVGVSGISVLIPSGDGFSECNRQPRPSSLRLSRI